jgi:hypothetical protein
MAFALLLLLDCDLLSKVVATCNGVNDALHVTDVPRSRNLDQKDSGERVGIHGRSNFGAAQLTVNVFREIPRSIDIDCLFEVDCEFPRHRFSNAI